MTDISATVSATAEAQGRSISGRILKEAMKSTGFRVGLAILVIILLASIILPEATSGATPTPWAQTSSAATCCCGA